MQYENENTAYSRYSACQLDRNLFLDRARESSELTIPTLIPPEGNNNTCLLYTSPSPRDPKTSRMPSSA